MTFNFGSISQSIFNIARRNTLEVGTRMERLSSALRINKGADDPSGLAISKGMTAQIRGTSVATQNLQDGISMLQTQDGGLAEIQDMLLRMRDLTLRGANEAVLTTADRERIQIELDGLSKEITRTSDGATFNGKKLLIGEDVPGGYVVTFWSNRDGAGDLYVMNADGSNQRRLTDQGANFNRSEISPDGTKILFNTARNGERDIYIMDKDGKNEINLTSDIVGNAAFPSWSPDGKQIVFSVQSDQIYIMNSDGSGKQVIVDNAFINERPHWSPDGSRIVFYSTKDGNGELYLVDIDGSNEIRLTDTAQGERNSFWSPDGKKLFFDRPGIGLYVMNADGTGETYITTGLANSWTKDGSSVLFQRGCWGQ